MVNRCVHFPVAALEAGAKAGHQNLTTPPPQGNTLLDGYPTGEANGMGGIAFSLIWAGGTQTAGCCQKFTSTTPPRG